MTRKIPEKRLGARIPDKLLADIEHQADWVERNLRGMVTSFMETTTEKRGLVVTTAIEVAMLKVAAEWSLMTTEILRGSRYDPKIMRQVFIANARRSYDLAERERKDGTLHRQVSGKWVPHQ